MHQDIAPARRKSCEACKSAKRRCDLAFPFCSRCAQRNEPCVYPRRQPAAFPDCDYGLTSLPEPPKEPWPILALTPRLTITNDPCIPLPPTSNDLDPLESQLGYANHAWPMQLPTPQETIVSPSLELALPRTRPLRPLSEIVASRLQFAIDILKDTPRRMVLENQTPWCHAQLYKHQMPEAMQDAYTCCSLYMSKNAINAPIIISLLNERIQTLLTSPEPSTLPDLLARTHALILYQIMHLFDGDIRFQATAEAVMTTLEFSVPALLESIHIPSSSEPSDLLPLSMGSITDFWNSWILQESARRTVLLTFYFLQIYKLLQGKTLAPCDGKLGLEHAWYMSAHLWNAQSAFDFAVAWAERPHFVVYNLDFSSAFLDARPGDIDLFGRMLLVTLIGIDEARAWFHVRGAVL